MEQWQEENNETSHEERPLRPHPWRKKVCTFAILCTIIVGVLRFTPIPFGIVKVVGDTDITAWDLVQTGQVQEPVNIFQISRNELAASLEKDLRVASVRIHYTLPLTLEVQLEARHAVASIATGYGYAELDEKGQCIFVDAAIHDNSLPVITGYKEDHLLLGDYVKMPVLLAAIQYIDALSQEGKSHLSEVNVGEEGKMIAYTNYGVAIRLGDTSKMKEKAKLTESMLQDIKSNHLQVEYIDVNLEAPFIKFRT